MKMAESKGIEMIIHLLSSSSAHVQRQSAKALANLGVNIDNKRKIAEANGIDPLIELIRSDTRGVQIEAIAAIANLAVNGMRIPFSLSYFCFSNMYFCCCLH